MHYRKKPVVIQALQWTGENWDEISTFAEGKVIPMRGEMHIHTLEGVMKASEGDYIVRGVCGEYYPCKPNIFEQTYEKVEE